MSQGHRTTLLLLLGALLLGSMEARGQGRRLVVADLYGEPDVRVEADSLTLLLRSQLRGEGLEVVERRELATGLQQVAGRSPRYALVVLGSEREPLLKRLRATSLISGKVWRDGTRLKATAALYGQGAELVDQASAEAPFGQLPTLARKLIQSLSGILGHRAPSLPPTSLGELHSFSQAEAAALAEDLPGAAQALQTADPLVARRLPAAAAVGREVAAMKGATPVQKLEAALFSGNLALAGKLASEVLAATPRNEPALAAQAYLAALGGDLDGAVKLLGSLGNDALPLALLARATVAHGQGKDASRDRALERLLRQDYLPALRFITQIPSGAMPQALEQTVLRHAQKHASSFPALAAALGLRAARGGIRVRDALELVRVDLLGDEERAVLLPLVDQAVKSGWSVGFRLRGELGLSQGQLGPAHEDLKQALKLRSEDLLAHRFEGYVLTERGELSEAAEALTRAASDGQVATRWELTRALEAAGRPEEARKLREVLLADIHIKEAQATRIELDQEGVTLGQALGGEVTWEQRRRQDHELARMLMAFPLLTRASIGRILLAPLPVTWRTRLWPMVVDDSHLGEGLRRLLSGQLHLPVRVYEGPAIGDITRATLQVLAARERVDALLLYGYRPEAAGPRIQLLLFTALDSEAYQFERDLTWRAGKDMGLCGYNPILKGLGALVACLAAGFMLLTVIRGRGEIKVLINRDPASKNAVFTLRLTRSPRRPALGDPEHWERRLPAQGARTRRLEATLVHGETSFDHLVPGRWHVHLLGTFRKGGVLRQVPETCSQAITVRRGQTSRVTFDLEPRVVEVKLSVFDGQKPMEGLPVWLGDDRKAIRLTDDKGSLDLELPRHRDLVLHVQALDILVDKPLRFDDTEVHSLAINLERERLLLDMDLHEDSLELALPPPRANALHEDTDDGAQRLEDEHRRSFGPVLIALDRRDVGQGQLADTDPAVPPIMTDERRAAPDGVLLANPAPQIPVAPRRKRPPSEVPVGLARYERQKELGRGGMGVVYLAQDRVLRRNVALKIIGDQLRHHPEARRLLLEEARAMAALNHPNLVTIYDQGRDGDETFVVMEYVEGGSLERLIRTMGPPPLRLGVDYAYQLCLGLGVAHERNIIHRDIKPENILISQDGVVKLGDFGLAKITAELAIKRTEIRGTPMYMSPEQIRGTDIDHRSDIYSLGCTLYVLFTGRPPFSSGEVLYHHLHTPPPPPSQLRSGLPDELDSILLACVRKDKEQRLGSTHEIREQLRTFVRRQR